MALAWRRFELGGVLGSSFEIAVDGALVVLKTATGGRNGREVRRPQASEDVARAEADRLIAAHLAKGYVEAGLLAEPAKLYENVQRRIEMQAIEKLRAEAEQLAAQQAADEDMRARAMYASDPALEAQCRAAPDDPAPWSVYADFLLQAGDPRGEYVTVPSKREAILALHGPRMCGTAGTIALELRHGFPIAATIGTVEDAAGFCNSPMATFVDTLHFAMHDESRAGAIAAIAASPIAPRLRVVRFDRFDYDDCMMHWAGCGPFGDALAKLTALEEFRIRGDSWGFGELPTATIRTFVRESCTLKSAEVASLAKLAWPVLEHLELWFGNADYGASANVGDLAPILAARRTPKLGHLGIRNSELAEPLLGALVGSKLLPQLYSLDLSMGTFGGGAVRALVDNAAAFRHLASIDLSENLLAPEDEAAITAVLDNVIIGSQRELDEDADASRYVAEHE